MSARIDAVTLEVMRNRWKGIAEEMCAALVRTSYSTNIKDRRDCSAAIALPTGDILAQAEVGTPLHLGIMPAVITSVLRRFPVEEMGPGDMYITNLPYPEGPGHLPDLSMISAVFDDDGRAVAIAASTAHHVDMGGFAPGSMPLGVTEIYQEGLQIPPTRMFISGEIDDTLYRLINQNVRTRHEVLGDLMAQYACACTAQRRVAEMLQRSDSGAVLPSMTAILDHGERRMRQAIAAVADGTCSFDREATYAMLLVQQLPSGVLGLMVVSLLAAFMSTMPDDIEEMLVATRKADAAYQMLVQVRSRLMEAYQEIKQLRE